MTEERCDDCDVLAEGPQLPRFEVLVFIEEHRVRIASGNAAAKVFAKRHHGDFQRALEKMERLLENEPFNRATILSAMAPVDDAIVAIRRATQEDAELVAVEVDANGQRTSLGTRMR